jgi:hypothetical protein
MTFVTTARTLIPPTRPFEWSIADSVVFAITKNCATA